MDYTKIYTPNVTHQQEKATPTQVKNNAGGYVFKVDPWMRLNRFLVLGTAGGTYYVSEKKHTYDNIDALLALIKLDGERVVNTLVEISLAGRAPNNDHAIFCLALVTANGNDVAKKLAYASISKVCRTGTHLFTFTQAVQNLRGWSRGLRNGVGAFYDGRTEDQVALQLIKYRQRNGWTHKDVLRLAHPKKHGELFGWAVGKVEKTQNPMVEAFQELQTLKADKKEDVRKAILLLKEFRLPWETLPTEFHAVPDVWEAMLPNMPLHAMLRHLNRLTSLGLLKSNLSTHTQMVMEKLNQESILKSRLHPLTILNCMATYASGHGVKGNMTWTPTQGVLDALNDAFYLAFGNVTPTGKRIYKALDVSGSMCAPISGLAISCRVASCAMAMVSHRVEKQVEVGAFGSTMIPVNLSPKMSLPELCNRTKALPWSGTDCSLPMQFALKNKIPVDLFEVYTDNETYAGSIHPFQALKQYRKGMGIDAKLVVIGMTATEFTIADPEDPGMLDIVGMDVSVPSLISDFVNGV